MVNPVNNPPPGPPPQGGDDPFQFTQQDTIAPALIDYLSAVSTARTNLREALSITAAQDPFLTSQAYLALGVNSAEQFLDLINQVNALRATWQAAFDGTKTPSSPINSAITTYNNQLQSAVNQINAAIAQYNNDHFLLAYTFAIANYKAAIDSANLQYISATQDYNNFVASIPTINSYLVQSGNSPIPDRAPTQAPLSYASGSSWEPPAAPPSGNITTTVPNPPTYSTISPVPAPATTSQMLPGIAFSLVSEVLATQQTLATISKDDFDPFASFTRDITLPNAFIKPVPTLLLNVVPDSPGASISLISKATGLSSPLLDRILGTALFTAAAQELGVPLTPRAYDLLHSFIFGVLSQVSDTTAAAIARQLQESGSPASTANPVTTILAFLNSIRDLVASNVIHNATQQLIGNSQEFTNLSATERQEFAAALAATINIGLLNVALTYGSAGLGVPGLAGQVLGNVNGVPVNLFAPTESSQIDGVILNPTSVVALKLALSELGGASQAQINTAINNLIAAGSFTSFASFSSALSQALTGQGVPTEVAARLATSAVTFVQNDASLPRLDTPLQPVVLRALTALASSSGTPTLTSQVGSLVSTLTGLLNSPDAATVVSTGLQSVAAAGPFNTTDALRAAALKAFRDQQIADEQAQAIADLIATQVAPAATAELVYAGIPAVLQAGTPERSALAQIATEIASHPATATALQNTLSTNPATIRVFREQLADQLASQGIETSEASRIVNLATRLLAQTPAADNILSAAPTAHAAATAGLADTIINYIEGRLKPILDEFRSRAIADQYVRSLISSNSILSEYNRQVRILQDEGLQGTVNAFIGGIPVLASNSAVNAPLDSPLPSVVNPSMLFASIDHIVQSQITAYMNPIEQDTLTRRAVQPTNWKRNLDIQV